MASYFSIDMSNFIIYNEGNVYFLIFILVLSYFFGSISFGLIFSKIFKLGDIRKIGSGNIGATNVLRTGNKLAAFFTLFFDAAKGALVILFSNYFENNTISVICGLLCFLGHLYPIFLRFQGGKGVATFFGILLSLNLSFGLIICVVWIVTLALSRFSSLSALVSSAFSIFLSFYFFDNNEIFLIIIICILIWLKHYKNIIRLTKGLETKIKIKK